MYLKQLNQEGSEVNPLHAFAYDAVWVAARVLVQVKETARKFGSLRNVSVGEEEEGKMLLEAVKSTHFEGVTVRTHTPETHTHTHLKHTPKTVTGSHLLPSSSTCTSSAVVGTAN